MSKTTQQTIKSNDELTARQHLIELRNRGLIVFGFFVIGTLPGFIWTNKLIDLFSRPLGQQLYFTTPAGGINFIFQIALTTGLVIALPAAVFESIQFARPTVSHLNSKYIIKVAIFSTLLAVAGLAYAYLFSLPQALHFLVGFSGDRLKSLLNATDYLQFVTTYLLASILIFQMPLVINVINRITPLKPGDLKRWQRPLILVSVVFAAIITPTPDPFNQMMVAGPLILLFEISVMGIWLKRQRLSATSSHRLKSSVSFTDIQLNAMISDSSDSLAPINQVATLKTNKGIIQTLNELPDAEAIPYDDLMFGDDQVITASKQPVLTQQSALKIRQSTSKSLQSHHATALSSKQFSIEPLKSDRRIDAPRVNVIQARSYNQADSKPRIKKPILSDQPTPIFRDIEPPIQTFAW